MSKKPFEGEDKYYRSKVYIDFENAVNDYDYKKLKELLYGKKVSINKHDSEAIVNAIRTLVRLNDSKLLSELLLSTNIQEKNIDIHKITINNHDLLWMADISSQNIDLIYVLLKAGYNTLYRPNDHFSLLHIVSKYDSVDAVKHVLNLRHNGRKFNPNTSDFFNGQTPLHYAIYGKNCPNVIKALLEAGTDPTIRHEAFSPAKRTSTLADNAFELALKSGKEYKPYEKTIEIILDHIIRTTLTGKEFKEQISLPPQYKAYFIESLEKLAYSKFTDEAIIPLFTKVIKVTDQQFYNDCATIIKAANKSLEVFSLNENALIGALNEANYAPAALIKNNESKFMKPIGAPQQDTTNHSTGERLFHLLSNPEEFAEQLEKNTSAQAIIREIKENNCVPSFVAALFKDFVSEHLLFQDEPAQSNLSSVEPQISMTGEL